MESPVTSPDVTAAVKRFEEAESSTRPARQLSERDRDYYDGKQWTSTEEAALKKRGQPVVTFNRIQRKVNSLKGLETQSRKDPKAFPRTPGDDGSAQAATDAIRYVCDDQDWDKKRSDAYESICVEGTGAIFVGAVEGKNGIDPALIQIPWDRHYHDPYSRRPDFSDAAYQGIVTWKEMADVIAAYPDREEVIETTWAKTEAVDTYDDKPKDHLWADHKRKRVRVCEEYYLEGGKWMFACFTGAGYLKDPEPSPYLDEDGKPECPIKAISAYVDRDNNRYGEVRAMISPQDEVNKRRSKSLHKNNTRQLRISPGVSVGDGNSDPTAIKRELAKADGVFFADKDQVEVLGSTDQLAVELQLLQEAKNEIDMLGPNADLQGKGENGQSGRAIMANQQGGMIEVALLMDRLRCLSLSVYRAIFARIKQYWTDERWIRVTDDERNLKWVGLNQPKTMLQMAAEKLEGDPQAEAKLQLIARDPQAHQVMEVQNPVAEMDVDIIIDEGMDTPMVQAEQFEMLSKIMPGIVNLPPPMSKMLIMASSLRDKDLMIEELDKMAQGGVPPELQQKIAEMERALQQMAQENQALKMDAEGAQADRQLKGAELQLKGQEIEQKGAELELDAYRAETERMTAMKPEPRQEAA